MRYVREEDRAKVRGVESVGNISVTGSVTGMQRLFGWKKGGQVRIGSYIYNVGTVEVARLRSLGLLHGEKR